MSIFSVLEPSLKKHPLIPLTKINHFAAYLISQGVNPGERVGLMAPSSDCWVIADLAILRIAAITVPFFDNASSVQQEFQSKDADIRMVLKEESLCHMEKICLEGERYLKEHPRCLEQRAALIKPESLATIIYTSGSTGQPKGVCLTHGNLTFELQAIRERLPLLKTDKALSVLPLAHVFERIVMWHYVQSGVGICFVRDKDKVAEAMRRMRPTLMTMVPRILEKIKARIDKGIEEKKGVRGKLALWAWRKAQQPQVFKGWKAVFAHVLVFRKIRKAWGGRLRQVIVGGAALDKHLAQVFWNIGLKVYQGYGLTESAPVLCVNNAQHNRLGTVGLPLEGVQIDIVDGEIWAKGPNIMQGYWKNPEESAKVLEDGWLKTGDLGSLDKDGFLTITGRAKELFKTSNGKYVSPLPIEHALQESPYIETAVVVAEGKNFVSALLFLAQDKSSTINREELDGSIRKHVEKVNQNLNHWEQIKEYRCLSEEISVANNLLTPTLKIRRAAIESAFKDSIEGIYQGHS